MKEQPRHNFENEEKKGLFFLNSARYNLNESEKIEKGLEKAKTFVKSLDLITICYHGIGRSLNTRRDIDDVIKKFHPDKKIKSTNIGFFQQINGLINNSRDALVAANNQDNIRGRVLTFLEDLADTITEAERIVIFDKKDVMKNALEKKLYDLIIEKANAKNKKVFYLFSDNSQNQLRELYSDLGLL